MGGNEYIPLEGDGDNFFERLSDYINRFGSDWKNNIHGASKEKIDRYIELATQNNKQLVIPKEYTIYLEKMGEDDGGLLEDFIKGSTNIDLLIDCYENVSTFSEHEDEILEYYDENTIGHLKIGHNIEVETEIFLKYYNNFEYEINKTVSANQKLRDGNRFSSTFEKLLFQSVLFKYVGVTKKYMKNCVVSNNFFKEKDVVDAKKVMHQIDEVCQKHGMTKVWISDQYNYIACNDNSIIYMKLDFNLHGNIWSDDEQFVAYLSDCIKGIWLEDKK